MAKFFKGEEGRNSLKNRKEILLGQFFLENREILQKIVEIISPRDSDVILEIGAGDGRMTKILAKKAKRVIAIEVDKKFKPFLTFMPKNVFVVFLDALRYFSKKPLERFNKIVGNLPSSLVEPLFQKLVKIKFQRAVFLVPEKFAYKIEKHPVFSLYLQAKLIQKVSKTAFSPVPKTNWEIVLVTKKKDPLKTGDLNLYLKRFIYEHPKAKTRNALTKGLIKFYSAKGKKLTKNQAREIAAKIKFN